MRRTNVQVGPESRASYGGARQPDRQSSGSLAGGEAGEQARRHAGGQPEAGRQPEARRGGLPLKLLCGGLGVLNIGLGGNSGLSTGIPEPGTGNSRPHELLEIKMLTITQSAL